MKKEFARRYGVVGWREWVTFPEFGHTRVKAKIDTGARTSAIHAERVELRTCEGNDSVTFDLLPDQDNDQKVVSCCAPLVERRAITDSGGHSEERFVVQTTVTIGANTWPIELSLTDRDSMGFRMLLGRTALRRRFLVNPGRSYLAGHMLK